MIDSDKVCSCCMVGGGHHMPDCPKIASLSGIPFDHQGKPICICTQEQRCVLHDTTKSSLAEKACLRARLAESAMKGIIYSGLSHTPSSVAILAIKFADALIEQLEAK